MSTAYIHIGMHKTGTTTIQHHLHSHRNTLEQKGLFYFSCPEPNHSLLMLTLFEDDPRTAHGVHFRRPSDEKTYFCQKSTLYDQFRTDLSRAADLGLAGLISGEAIYHLSRDGLERLRSTLRSAFDKVIILGLVRPPLSFAESYAQEALKTGACYRDFLLRPPSPNYRRRIQPYIETFGKDNTRLRLFAPSELVDGCPLKTVLSMADSELLQAFSKEKPLRRNLSISLTAAKVLSALNYSRRQNGSHLGRDVLNAIRSIPGDPAQLPVEIKHKVMAAEEDIAWMSQVCGVNLPDHDDADMTGPPLEAMSSFSADEMVRVCSALGLSAKTGSD